MLLRHSSLEDVVFEKRPAIQFFEAPLCHILAFPILPKWTDYTHERLSFRSPQRRKPCDLHDMGVLLMRVVIPDPTIRAPSGRIELQDVVVTAHDVRKDVVQPGVVTALDAIISLTEPGQVANLELTWYHRTARAEPVDSYWVERINDDVASGGCGFVYECGSREFSGFAGAHTHIPADVQVSRSPEYALWFWICLGRAGLWAMGKPTANYLLDVATGPLALVVGVSALLLSPSVLTDPDPLPEERVTQQGILETVQRLIVEELTERQQQAVIGVVFAGMPTEEVPRRVGTNRNALHKLMQDARRRLKGRSCAEGMSLEDALAAFETPSDR